MGGCTQSELMGVARMNKKFSGVLPADHWSFADHPPLLLYPHPDWAAGVGKRGGFPHQAIQHQTALLAWSQACLANRLSEGTQSREPD